MRKRLLVGLGVLLVLAGLASAALPLWLQSDALRRTLEAQATAAIGRQVRIERARVALLPRPSITLANVTVGDPPRTRVDQASMAMGFRALWSRQVEDADVQLTGGHVEPSWLAVLVATPPSLSGSSTGPVAGLTIVSIRSLRLRDVVLTVDDERIPVRIDASLDGDRLVLTDGTVWIRDEALHVSGEISSLARREGHATVHADVLPVSELVAVLGQLMGDDGTEAGASPMAPGPPFRLTAAIAAPAAILGSHRLDAVASTLEATASSIVLDPVTFGYDDGRFEMRVALDRLDRLGLVDTNGRVSGLDVARLQAGASRAGTLTGRLDATFALRAPPQADLLAMIGDSRGSVDLHIGNGRMPGIAIVRQSVLRFANRAGPPPRLEATDAFSRLDASLTLQPGAARITRLSMQAADFDLDGHGVLWLHDWKLALDATVTLTEELSQQAGRDLYRYARDGRRIVLPVVLGGTLYEPTATIDVGQAAGRAIRNRIEDEVKSLLERLGRKPPPS